MNAVIVAVLFVGLPVAVFLIVRELRAIRKTLEVTAVRHSIDLYGIQRDAARLLDEFQNREDASNKES